MGLGLPPWEDPGEAVLAAQPQEVDQVLRLAKQLEPCYGKPRSRRQARLAGFGSH
jgi:hypothetical protein